MTENMDTLFERGWDYFELCVRREQAIHEQFTRPFQTLGDILDGPRLDISKAYHDRQANWQ
jgi:hypothetical protein